MELQVEQDLRVLREAAERVVEEEREAGVLPSSLKSSMLSQEPLMRSRSGQAEPQVRQEPLPVGTQVMEVQAESHRLMASLLSEETHLRLALLVGSAEVAEDREP